MDTYTCTFCGSTFSIVNSTTGISSFQLDLPMGLKPAGKSAPSVTGYFPGVVAKEPKLAPEQLRLVMMRCPTCKKVTVFTVGEGAQYEGEKTFIYPRSAAKQFPDYIPKQIRQDYEEAYSILHLSPKASATLSRRCLQGMVRDFFGVKGNNLQAEINKIRDLITPEVKSTLDSVRQIGNIGAHMEKDVNLIIDISDGESERLLKLIEFLMQSWYINRHDAEILMQEIRNIDQDKQDQRKN